MAMLMSIGNKNQQNLAKSLGPDYSLRIIDLEPCVYRKFSDRIDIEIVGATRRKGPFSVYVWDISQGVHDAARIIDTHHNIPSQDALKELLDELAKKYGTGDHIDHGSFPSK